MVLHISREEARRSLALYHFKPADLPGVIDRLGTVQYDPLNPVGRNADLMDALRTAVENFLHYLRADGVCVGENVDALAKQAVFV